MNRFLTFKEQFHLLQDENLISDKETVIKDLLEYLGCGKDVEVGQILEATSFQSMKKQNPEHVRSGKKIGLE